MTKMERAIGMTEPDLPVYQASYINKSMSWCEYQVGNYIFDKLTQFLYICQLISTLRARFLTIEQIFHERGQEKKMILKELSSRKKRANIDVKRQVMLQMFNLWSLDEVVGNKVINRETSCALLILGVAGISY